MARGEAWAETGVGALVLFAAGGFLVYALSHVGGGASGYQLTARFGQVGALATGADVRLAGVKVGTVSAIDLDPKTFLAKATLEVDPKIRLPQDSTIKITSDGLLGGQHVSIEPGGSTRDMAPGSEFQNVQGAVDLFGLIGQVLRPPVAATPAAATATPSAAPAAKTDPYPG